MYAKQKHMISLMKIKVPIIKNWLDKEGFRFIQTLTNTEKDACKSTTGHVQCTMRQIQTTA